MNYNYDNQILNLTAFPESIPIEWKQGLGLFAIVGCPSDIHSGCLTQIACNIGLKAVIRGKIDEQLTQEISNDERIPLHPSDITIESLQVFKEWQMRIDKLQEQPEE